MKTLLTGALTYDGLGGIPLRQDVMIEGERILAIGQDLPREGARVWEMDGLSLSPGFIDAHSHNDWCALWEDPLPAFEPFIRQGITGFVTGNCGLSAAGFEPDSPHLSGLGGGIFQLDESFKRLGSAGQFFRKTDRQAPCNLALLIGHNTVRASVSGSANRPLTDAEMTRMLNLMEDGLKEGACGISLGLMYDPGLYAPREELLAIARLCERYDRPLAVHARALSKVSMAYKQLLGRPHLLRALDELHDLAKGSRLKLHYSHAIFVGRRSFTAKDEVIRIIDQMASEGIDIGFDIYHETLGVTVITVVMPPWYQALSAKKKRQLFNRLRFTLLARASILLLGFNFDDILIARLGEGHEQYEGKTVAAIAREMGVGKIEAYLRLCEMSDFKGRVNMGPYSTPAIIDELAKHPRALFMTDAWWEPHGVQNPAMYDCFPKFLQQALLGQGDTLPNTIMKMTGATARRFGLKDRGVLRPGAFADITIFNEAELLSGVPDQEKAFGIRHVLINGIPVLENGRLNAAVLRTSGQAMRVS
ncbi:MAG: N-acyl-D-amino-acid deacylase family protein [Christensenellales bacterium]|jgi:N-acyl-D-amino-acid deacylase